MKKYFTAILAALAALSNGLGAASPDQSFIDPRPVVIKAAKLPALVGRPRPGLAVLARRNGKFIPVSFQVDPRDENGYVLGPPGAPLSAATPAGPLGALDEFVFMAKDGGEKGPPPPAMDPAYLVTVRNAAGGDGYFWVGQSPGAPRSRLDRAAYTLAGQEERIETGHYIQVYDLGRPFFRDISISEAAGGNGRDMMDGLKMRSRARTVAGISLAWKESDFRSKLGGVRDGPVRVIRRTDTSLALLLGLATPSVTVNAFFYESSYEVPSTLRFPYRADFILSELDYYQGCDLMRSEGPYTFHADVAPRGVTIDGKMSPAEEVLHLSRSEHAWGLVTGPAGTLFYHGTWTDREAPVKLGLFYVDDADTPDPPETESGSSMYGFRLLNPLDMGDRAYDLNIVNYVVPRFDGDADRLARVLSAPISSSVAREKGRLEK